MEILLNGYAYLAILYMYFYKFWDALYLRVLLLLKFHVHNMQLWDASYSNQGHSKVFTTGQARIYPEHYVIKCMGGW